MNYYQKNGNEFDLVQFKTWNHKMAILKQNTCQLLSESGACMKNLNKICINHVIISETISYINETRIYTTFKQLNFIFLLWLLITDQICSLDERAGVVHSEVEMQMLDQILNDS